jgi:hypothetical protein
MPGHVLHLRDLYCHCLSQPLPSLSFSVHISHSITRFPAPSLSSGRIPPFGRTPPRFPHAFLTALCPFWHICCLGTEFGRLPLVRLPCWRYRWKRLILFFLESPRTLQSDFLHILLHVTLGYKLIESTYGQQNRLSTPVVCD